MSPPAMMNDLVYSLLLALVTFTCTILLKLTLTDLLVFKENGNQEIFQILLKKSASFKFQKNLFGLEGNMFIICFPK